MSDAPACPRCGARVPVGRMETCPKCLFEGGTVVGGVVELAEEIGRGGMGAVYRAKHLRLGRPVAVKFLPDELAGRPEFRSRFEREARALAMLDHPHIVRILDFVDGALVMELVEGGTVADRLPVGPVEAIRIARQVCEALAYAHGRGVVHRDIKPENLLLDSEGRVKVADFGIARLLRPEDRGWTVTSTSESAGTPHYVAPEAMAAGAVPDPRMDLYSLGVVLYHMATGRLPVGDFEPAPGGLDRIVRRALAPDPARRYASAEEMGRDLAALSGAASKAKPGALEPHEELLVKGVATLQSISTAVALWTFVVSVSPKVIAKADVIPLVMIGITDLGDGTVLTRARFETWWTLAALATFGAAITAYAFLRLHWRRVGLERGDADRPIAESRWVVAAGLVACGVYGLRLLVDWEGERFVGWPLVGGALEVAVLFFFWVTVLKAWRVSRPLSREPLLWAGFLLAVAPPAVELYRFVTTWTP